MWNLFQRFRSREAGVPYHSFFGRARVRCSWCGQEHPVTEIELVRRQGFCQGCQAPFPIRQENDECEEIWEHPKATDWAWALATMPGKADGHIRGFRGWRLNRREGQPVLTSLSVEVDWPPGMPLIAEELHSDLAYGPGIYAMKSRYPLLAGVQRRGFPVRGEVALWGTVVEHEDGFRGRYAYPTHLMLSSTVPGGDPKRVAAELEERYEVPVEPPSRESALGLGWP